MAKTIRRPLFDRSQIQEFRDVFPELTEAQFETAMLLSLGLTRKEIALQRDVSHLVVRDMLQDINERMDFHSTSNLISMFQVRLVFFALSECKRHNNARSLSGIDKTDEGSHHA